MQIIISPSDKPNKKFEARIDGKKSIHFGATGIFLFKDLTLYFGNAPKYRI